MHWQIAIGLVPATLFFLALGIWKRNNRIRNFVLFGCFAFLIIFNIKIAFSSRIEKQTLDSINPITLVYALIEQGNIDLADELLNDIHLTSQYTLEQTLCTARLYSLKGRYNAAQLLYEKIATQTPELSISEEQNLISNAAETDKVDFALLTHLNFNHNKYSPVDKEQINKNILSFINTDNNDDKYNRVAKYIVNSYDMYNNYLENKSQNEEEIKKALRKINNLEEEYPEIFVLPLVRIARLKLQILAQDYKSIAENVDEYSDYSELLTVSELYMRGFIKNEYFNEDYKNRYTENYSKIAENLEQVYNKHFFDAPKSIKEKVKMQIKSLNTVSKYPALMQIENSLLEYTEQSEFYNSSKVFLQAAKIELRNGNEIKANEYIDASLNTVGDCDDNSFTQPMYEIIKTISEKDNSENLKNVKQYVDEVLTNSTTIQIPSDLKTQQISNTDNNEKSTTSQNIDTFLADYVSKKRASINIMEVNIDNFPKIKATFSVDDNISYSANQLTEILSVQDCGNEIIDFNIEKTEYSKANILLCCDTSGSMSGNAIYQLKKAIELFIQNREDIESIALVTFSNSIDNIYEFGTSDNSLLEAVQKLNGNGGTDIYNAVIQSIDMFSPNSDELNCIILMSDGEDNSPKSEQEILDNIGKVCIDKGIYLYSIGLGTSVDSSYLSNFANFTGGNYLYVNDSDSLFTFYNYLHSQILNQYTISFEAKDTLSNQRVLDMSLNLDSLAYDSFEYSLYDEKTDDKNQSDNNEIVYLKDRSIYGLDTKLLYKNSNGYKINLKGDGFKKEDLIELELIGNLKYNSNSIICTYIDSNTVEVQIPAGIACDVYDVNVSINRRNATLENELTVVVQGNEKLTSFGPYVFTSYSKSIDGDTITLSNLVTLNGWLNFKKEVTLKGSLTNSSILLTDNFGTYIKYYDGISEGLASMLAKSNINLNMPKLGELRLFNDISNAPSSDDYLVEPKSLPYISILDFITFETPAFSLYPDRIVLKSYKFKTDFPFQEEIFKGVGINEMFSFETDLECIFTFKNIGIKLENSFDNGIKNYLPIDLGNMPMYFSPKNCEIKIDTIKNEYYFKFIVKLAFLDANGLGFSIKLKGLKLSEIKLYADFDLNAVISGVPITFSDFHLGASDLEGSPLEHVLEGGMDVSAVSISSILPGLENWIGDLSILKLDDATLKYSFLKPYIGVSTDMNILEYIQISSMDIEAGTFKYSNWMLGLDEVSVIGFKSCNSYSSLGANWVASNCNINLNIEGSANIIDRFIGIHGKGKCHIDVGWWVKRLADQSEAEVLIGIENIKGNMPQFVLKAVSNSTQDKARSIYIIWNRNTGIDVGEIKLS